MNYAITPSGMNTMEAIAVRQSSHYPLVPSFHRNFPSFSRPICSRSFRTRLQSSLYPSFLKSSSSSFMSMKEASPTSSSPFPYFSDNNKNLKSQSSETLKSFPLSIFKTALISALTVIAFFFAGQHIRPSIATPIPPPPTIETIDESDVTDDDNQNEIEIALEKHLDSNPDDVEALGILTEIKTKKWKVPEAISILERLIKLEPDYTDWKLLKSHLHCNTGDLEKAKVGFREVLEKDPLRVEAYHGLLVAATVADSSSEKAEVEKMLDKGMEICKQEERKDVLTGLKLLLAQIRVLEGKYDEGLKIYEELAEEEPTDFRPYLCQGILYTLLKRKEEAEECLEKFRSLVPKGHPFEEHLDNGVLFPKSFGSEQQEVEIREQS